MAGWFDSHCHLYSVDDPEEAMGRARAEDVIGALVLGTDEETSHQAVELTRIDGVWAGAAVHPTSTEGWTAERIEAIGSIAADDRVAAIGESGIDLYWDKHYLDDQVAAFEAHIALSKTTGKALVIHTRDSVDVTLDVLERTGPPERLVFHCWSGPKDALARALGMGSFISFAGNVTFKNASDLRERAAEVPDDRLLVETDSPYLAPVPQRGKPNEPAYVRFTGEVVASARGQDVEAVAEMTTANARTIFQL